MCDIWFTRHDNPNQGGYARFMPVDATDDGLVDTVTSTENFYIIKIPGVDKNHPAIQKFFARHEDQNGELIARRRWILRGNDLPLAVRRKFQQQGFVTIKVGNYGGDYDYTWNQVKNYFRENVLGQNGGGDI